MTLTVMLILISTCLKPSSYGYWGFFAHRLINRIAVFGLPLEMLDFYKQNIGFLTDKATAPDSRRYRFKNEAPRHFIDLDIYGDSAWNKLPRRWSEAVELFGEDSLMKHGIAPWHIQFMKYQLTEAFLNQDAEAILRLSADIGHYISDAHVPLHTTRNYNGQLTGQLGIHGFWESRLPELFSDQYDLFVGKAFYIEDPTTLTWDIVRESHAAVDSILLFERQLSELTNASKKYSYELRKGQTVRTHSEFFSSRYHEKLNGMVERRLRASILRVSSFWYTCWVDGGQPNIEGFLTESISDSLPIIDLPNVEFRNHESVERVNQEN